MRRNVYGASVRTCTLARGLAAKVRDTFDGMFRNKIVPHHPTDELLITRTQPARPHILEHVKRIRNEPEALRPLSFGVWALSIPFEDMEMLRRANPELSSSDRETRTKAWRKFIASPESLPYRVRERP